MIKLLKNSRLPFRESFHLFPPALSHFEFHHCLIGMLSGSHEPMLQPARRLSMTTTPLSQTTPPEPTARIASIDLIRGAK